MARSAAEDFGRPASAALAIRYTCASSERDCALREYNDDNPDRHSEERQRFGVTGAQVTRSPTRRSRPRRLLGARIGVPFDKGR